MKFWVGLTIGLATLIILSCYALLLFADEQLPPPVTDHVLESGDWVIVWANIFGKRPVFDSPHLLVQKIGYYEKEGNICEFWLVENTSGWQTRRLVRAEDWIIVDSLEKQ